jgi:LacI family transcriptional regulator
MSATIKEVARAAGVSVATVSRVLNDSGPVREETRQRIRAVVDRLRYVPHGAARSLTTNSTSTVGVLLPDIHGEFFSEVIRGLDATARRGGYHVLVSSAHSEPGEMSAVLRALRGRVDGLIVMSPHLGAEALQADLSESLPTLLLNCRADGSPFASIEVDNYGGARAMVRHLAGLGHRRIALIQGPAHNYDAEERLRGYRDAMRALGAPEFTVEGDFSEEGGYRAARQLLALAERPSAIFAVNDSMAIGCLFALREAGVAVPEEIALGGFDDIPIARFITPPLTSVSVSIAELGELAMARLLAGIEGGRNGVISGIGEGNGEQRRETLPTRLVVRASCGAALGGTRKGDMALS